MFVGCLQGTYVERVTGAQYEGEFSEGLFHGLGKLSLPTRSPSVCEEDVNPDGQTSRGAGKKRHGLASRCSRIGVHAPRYSSPLASAENEEDPSEKKADFASKGVTICGEWEKGKVRGVATCAYEDGCLYTGTLHVRYQARASPIKRVCRVHNYDIRMYSCLRIRRRSTCVPRLYLSSRPRYVCVLVYVRGPVSRMHV